MNRISPSRKSTRLLSATLAVFVVAISQTALLHWQNVTATAGPPTAMELVQKGLAGAVGPDDEGPYTLIDPVGPGGVSESVAAAEVFAPRLQGGNYGSHGGDAQSAGYP
ncbi:MAG: hypothetical protein GIW99_09080 [Candidatus Eremiobacteraeota bacterium]|nr:hypothetical protein [Candidatus Eremiobacteraeota bacterium]MBC5827816.1 hypothetical protein [Candidatus Eremiobacteraeota bacterium]